VASERARTRTMQAFEAVRRRARLGSAFVVAAHGALGAAFGTALARMGDGGPWAMASLAIVAGIISAGWSAGRLPVVAAGRVIEARYPNCRNVLVTAEELLSGELEVNAQAAERVFERAAGLLDGIDAPAAARVGPRIAASAAVIAASTAIILWFWRT
jgi:hypothetical protein